MPLPDKDTIAILSGISLSYEQRTILRDVNLTINKRDFVVVTGANGSGKTSLIRILLKLIEPSTGSVSFYCDGRETHTLPIGYLPQKNSIDNRFPISVEEVVSSGLYNPAKAVSRSQVAEQVAELLAYLGLDALAQRHIGVLSGGELQRTLLARAVISQPQLLVLDEPLSYIDEAFTPRIYDLLAQQASRRAVVMVTHRPALVANLATQTIKIDTTVM